VSATEGLDLPADGRPDSLSSRLGKDAVHREGCCVLLHPRHETASGGTDQLAVEEREPIAEPRPRSAVELDRLGLDLHPAPNGLSNSRGGESIRRSRDQLDHPANVVRFHTIVKAAIPVGERTAFGGRADRDQVPEVKRRPRQATR